MEMPADLVRRAVTCGAAASALGASRYQDARRVHAEASMPDAPAACGSHAQRGYWAVA